jgi:hypothetical protein
MQRQWRRRSARFLAAALAFGYLLQGPGCIGTIQQELSVLLRPEASTDLFYDSILANSSIGRFLIKLFV